MAATRNYLAIDLGASNGRVLAGRWDGRRFDLEELHRFPNGPVNVNGHLHTDALRLWTEIKTGFAAYAARFKEQPFGISLDTWGVDYGLLDSAGNLLGNPYHYRDGRTQGIADALYRRVPASEVYAITGLQTLPFNTVFQLYSMVREAHPQLAAAGTMLMLPDLFNYWLTGEKTAEYTIASTTQMLDCRSRAWATGLLEQLGIPAHILPRLVQPGTVLATLRADIAAETGLERVPVIAGASHDTGSAVAAIPGLDASNAYISSGTWSLVGMEVSQPIITPEALAMNFTNEGGVGGTIRFLRNITGLWLLQESVRQWQNEGRAYKWDELMQLALDAPAFRSMVDPEFPSFLAPRNMPAAIRDYCRQTGQPVPETDGQIARGCLEGMALRYRWAIEAMERVASSRVNAIRIVGGGCQNRVLNQFAANACGREVITGPVEAAALGLVMMQAVATGELPDIAAGREAVAASVTQERYQPNETAAWDDAYGRFQKIIAGAATAQA